MKNQLLRLLILFSIGVGIQAQDDNSSLALDYILEAEQAQSTTLDLSDLGLSELPAEIGHLTNLEILNLNGNRLTTLPPEIGQLNSLKTLGINDNQLVSLPPEIGQLTNLQSLYIGNNQLTSLPPEIGQLTNLVELHVANNQLTGLPLEIGRLNNLQISNFNGNSLDSIPAEVIAEGTTIDYVRDELLRRNIINYSIAGLIILFALGLFGYYRSQYLNKKKLNHL